MADKQPTNIDEYIAGFPENVRDILQKLRQVIKKTAPGARETISYGMPAFKLKRILVYFAAWKNHIGLYGASSAVETFKEELSPYEITKGTIKFPLDKPIPYKLVEKIVKFRVKEVINRE